MDYKRIIVVLVIASSLFLTFIKLSLVILEQRYIPFGYDSTRVMGYTQILKDFGYLDFYANNRWGLPLFAMTVDKLVPLSASQLFLLPLMILNFGSLILSGALTYSATRSAKTSLIVIWLVAVNSTINLVSDSNFMTTLVTPLRFLVLVLLLNQASRFRQSLLIFMFLLISVYANLTYPIQNLLVDVLVILMVIGSIINGNQTKLVGLWVILTNLLAYLVLFITYNSNYDFSLDWSTFINYVYAIYATGINLRLVASLVALFLLAQVGLMLLLFNNRFIKLLRSKHLTLNSRLFRKPQITGIGLIILSLLVLVTYLNSVELNRLNLFRLLFNPNFITAGVSLSFLYLLNISNSQKFNPVLKVFDWVAIGFIVLSATSPWLGSVGIALLDSRFSGVYMMCLIISLSIRLVKLKPNWLFTWLFIFLLLVGPVRFIQIEENYSLPGNLTLARAMDWLSQQPESHRYIVYADYINSKNIEHFEKFHSMAFLANPYPWGQLKTLGRCEALTQTCLEDYRQFVRKHKVKYLVLENDYSNQSYQLRTLGKTIYEDGVIIVELFDSGG